MVKVVVVGEVVVDVVVVVVVVDESAPVVIDAVTTTELLWSGTSDLVVKAFCVSSVAGIKAVGSDVSKEISGFAFVAKIYFSVYLYSAYYYCQKFNLLLLGLVH